MRKIIAALAVSSIVLTFTACNNKTQSGNSAAESPVQQTSQQISERIPEVEKTPDKDLKIFDVLPEIPETPQSELQYKLDGEIVRVTGYTGDSTNIRIPDTIESKKVAEVTLRDINVDEIIVPSTLGKYKLSDCSAKYVNIPACPDTTFITCNNIEKAYFEDGVEETRSGLFINCKSLTQVRMPQNLKKISDSMFDGCENLKYVEIPENVEEIGDYAFAKSGITAVKLPNTEIKIGYRAFSECAELTSFSFGGGLIINEDFNGEECLSECPKLEEVVIPNGVKEIPKMTFYNCAALKRITLPQSVEKIGGHAFLMCNSLSEITLSEGLRIIGEGAFKDNAVKEISIPNGVTEIGGGAFCDCTQLTKAELPDSLNKLGEDCFLYAENCAVTYNGKSYSYDKIANEDTDGKATELEKAVNG